MQGKLKAFISNTMNTMLELLTRGNRLTGMCIYSNDCFLFSNFFLGGVCFLFYIFRDQISVIICISKFLTEPNWEKLTRLLECFLKCFVQLIRLRKLKKLLLRFVQLIVIATLIINLSWKIKSGCFSAFIILCCCN